MSLWGVSSLLAGQEKLNITILGTAHHFNDEYQELQDFERVKNFIVDLAPDIICMEATPSYDTASLKEISPVSMKNADLLRDTLSTLDISDSLVRNGAIYYSQYNFWNAYYQWYLAEASKRYLGPFSEHHYDLSNSEYGLMIFPAAQQIGIQEFFTIDYRHGEKEFLKKNSKVLKRLLISFKWKPLRVYLKTQKKYKKASKEGKLMEFINSSQFQESFSNLIDDLPNRLTKSEDAHFIKSYWLMRNEIMAERVIERAIENNARKVLVTVGGAHVTHMKKFLLDRGHAVATYGDFLSKENE